MAPLAGKPRAFGRGLALTVVTLGLYGLYWNAKAFKEVYDQEKRADWPVVPFVLGIFVFPIIWYYQYQAIAALNEARARRGLPAGVTGGTFLLWATLGAFIVVGPFIAYHKAQTSLNELWSRYGVASVPVTTPPARPPMRTA